MSTLKDIRSEALPPEDDGGLSEFFWTSLIAVVVVGLPILLFAVFVIS